MIEEIYDRNASLSIYQKKKFIYLYVWSADCNSAIYSELQCIIGGEVSVSRTEFAEGEASEPKLGRLLIPRSLYRWGALLSQYTWKAVTLLSLAARLGSRILKGTYSYNEFIT